MNFTVRTFHLLLPAMWMLILLSWVFTAGAQTQSPDPNSTPTPNESTSASTTATATAVCAAPEGTPAPGPDTIKYEGPTSDWTGVPLIYEKTYDGNGKCTKKKKFYYCAPCSDLNDESPTIWIDPATAKFLFEPPYALGGQATLGEVNFLGLVGGTVSRYKQDLDPDETNPNAPFSAPAEQEQRVIAATIPAGLTPIRTQELEE